jgi:hypothetical protein
MSTIINGTSSAITFPDSSVQNTSAIVSGYVPYANLPAGSVLQVVNVDYGTETSSASSTFSDTGLTATITPKFATSKILVLVTQEGCAKASNNTALQLKLLRNGSVILNIDDVAGENSTTTQSYFGACATNYLDSPATTSAMTYKTQFASRANNGTVYVQAFGSNSGYTRSTITLMEIAG